MLIAAIGATLLGSLPTDSRASGGQELAAIGGGYVTYDSISSDWSWASSTVDYSGAGYCAWGDDWITASVTPGQIAVSGTTTTTDAFTYIGFLSTSSLTVTGGATATALINVAGQSASGAAQCWSELGFLGFMPASISNTTNLGISDSDNTPLSATWSNVDTFPSATEYLNNVTSASASN